MAIWFFFLIFAPSVKLIKKGKFPIVSIVIKNKTNEFKKIVNDVKSRPILMDDILSVFRKNPEYQKINSAHPRHEGYKKSLLED